LVALLAYSFLQSGEESPLNPIAAAAERAQTQPGARFTVKASYSSDALEVPLTARGRGAYNSVTGLGEAQMWMDVPHLGPAEIEMVNDDSSFFMRSDREELLPLPDGKEWMKVKPFLGGSQNELMLGSDPESTLQVLAAISGDVRERGQETVRGKATERYRTSFRLTDVAEVLREEGKDEMADLYEKYGKLNPGPTVAEAWIDEEEVLRRMRMVMELPIEDQPTMTMDMQMEFFDFGARPEVTLPEGDAVFDATPFLEEELEEVEGD
jgi:hypothetical protein